MFKLFVFLALVAIALAVPKAAPRPQFYSGLYGGYGLGYSGLGYSGLGYSGLGYASPYAYGGYGYY